MNALGISLYPEKSDYESDKTYLSLAKKYGFSRVFMNLLLFKVKMLPHLLKDYVKQSLMVIN